MPRATKPERKARPLTIFRYASPEHQELIRKCAEYAGVSMNDWICLVTLKAARREARLAEQQTTVEA